MKSALITGITGQDGRLLSKLLLERGYDVYGLVRNTNSRLPDEITCIYGDITSLPSLPTVDEVYNLAAFTHVGESFRNPTTVARVNYEGAQNVLNYALDVDAKYYQASTSEMFGNIGNVALNEKSLMLPVSPYGVAKLAAHETCRIHREIGYFVCCGILFNHESPIRGKNFVTRKVTDAIQSYTKYGMGPYLSMGAITSYRDWGYAGDYVKAMWLMMQQSKPGDYVIATNASYTVEKLLEIAYGYAGLDWKDWVNYDDEAHKRPNELKALRGDYSKAQLTFGWEPKMDFEHLVEFMIEHEDTGEFWQEWM